MNIVLGIVTFILVLVSLFLIMVILMQKAKSDGGVGGVMGGGMAEATFGADTSNVLTKATINASIVFFVLAIALYLTRIYRHTHGAAHGALPTLSGPVIPRQPAPFLPPTSGAAAPLTPLAPAPSSPARPGPAPFAAPSTQAPSAAAPTAASAAPSSPSAQGH